MHFLHVSICDICRGGLKEHHVVSESIEGVEMKKIKIVTKEILAFNFRQAYEVLFCKCNCWESKLKGEADL